MRLIWCYEKPCQILRHETSFRLYLLQVLFIWAVENSRKSGISRCVISHNSIILKHVLQLLSLGLILFHKCLLWFLEIKSINSVSNDFFQDVYIAQVSISSRNHCLNASGLSWICWAHCHSQESLTEWTGILKTTLNFAGFFFFGKSFSFPCERWGMYFSPSYVSRDRVSPGTLHLHVKVGGQF